MKSYAKNHANTSKCINRVIVDQQKYDGTLLDLPCFIEGMKTIDYKTLFKSTDVSQIMLVTNKEKTSEEIKEFEDFIYEKDEYASRHGITPPSFDVREKRFKKEGRFKKEDVNKVENQLKDIIESGFADNVVEELLIFNESGELKEIKRVEKAYAEEGKLSELDSKSIQSKD